MQYAARHIAASKRTTETGTAHARSSKDSGCGSEGSTMQERKHDIIIFLNKGKISRHNALLRIMSENISHFRGY